jgi:NADH-quinone oxidoreductase subunit J
MVLFLFVVMMLDINVEKIREGFTRYLPLGVAVALIVVVEIGHVIWFRSQGLAFITTPKPTPEGYSNTKELGAVLYTQHVYAFEIASVILLLAIVAAITLTMRERRGLKVQNVAKQVAVRREDRVRIVKVETSTER